MSTQKQQLVLKKEGEEHRLPIEDLGVVVLEHPQITITHSAISRLLDHQVAVITCNDQHLPQGLMLPLDGHHLQQAHFRTQVEATQAQKRSVMATHRSCENTKPSRFITSKWNRHGKYGTLGKQGVRWRYGQRGGRAAAHYWKKLFEEQLERFTRGRYDRPLIIG